MIPEDEMTWVILTQYVLEDGRTQVIEWVCEQTGEIFVDRISWEDAASGD